MHVTSLSSLCRVCCFIIEAEALKLSSARNLKRKEKQNSCDAVWEEKVLTSAGRKRKVCILLVLGKKQGRNQEIFSREVKKKARRKSQGNVCKVAWEREFDD